MAKTCPVTHKHSRVAGSYSNRIRATQFNPTGKSRRQPNFKKKTIYLPELGKSVQVLLSAKGIKTMHKRGAYVTLKKAGII